MVKFFHQRKLILFLAVIGFTLFQSASWANHSWGTYHWARTNNPFTIKLGDNLTATDWKNDLSQASSDWSASSVMNTTLVVGQASTAHKKCTATLGRVEVCNNRYGGNWLGVANIWLSGTHITQGTVRANDSWVMNKAEKQHVMCQEVGHTFGLDHQSTDGSSQNTCMDYYSNKSDSDLKSTRPNQHDYDELVTIYTHLDSTTTISSAPAAFYGIDLDGPGQWGKLVKVSSDGRHAVYVLDFGHGYKVVTFVIWANGAKQ